VPHLISLNELLQIVTDAGLLHQRAFYETSLSKMLVNGGDPLADISTVYEVAEALSIPEERVRAIMAVRYPEAAEQLGLLETQGAVATTRAVARTYQSELLTRLRLGLPSRSFEAVLERSDRLFDQPFLETKWRRDYTVRIVLVSNTEVTVRRRPTWRRLYGILGPQEKPETKREEVVIATIVVGNEVVPHSQFLDRGKPAARFHRTKRLYLEVTVASAIFLKLGSGALEELRTRFSKHNGIAKYELIYDYVVE
jgi:hypothetical protein